MEWSQALFVAFMAATVSGLLGITLMLHEIKKKLPVEHSGRNHRNEQPLGDIQDKLGGIENEVSFEHSEPRIGMPEQEARDTARSRKNE